MASIILSAAGAAAGGGLGVPFGAAIGQALGKSAGWFIDDAIFGPVRLKDREGPRLGDLAVQTSTYGRMIPIVYGSVRIAGNVVWARPIKEVAATTTSTAGGGKGGGGRVSQSSTAYSYYISMAVAICEGPVDEVLRIWADSRQLDLSQGTYRIYKGDETQLPDPFIEGFEGVGGAPAYRGLAYVVVEDFPLADYGNRIPNFTFEVKKKALYPDFEGEPVEKMIESMIMIPGSGEFVYDTYVEYKIAGEEVDGQWVQRGDRERINSHNPMGAANAVVALDQLAETCPNVEWIGVVVTWFGDSLDAGDCVILPGVEYQEGAITAPDSWEVAGYTRDAARQITLVDGVPRYGGTPSDAALLRYLDLLIGRGYKIMFYPMFFMDVEDKPWRGRVTGTPAEAADFFTRAGGYNAFVTHYADLVADKVDAFVIGSELIGLTKVRDVDDSFPAVDELVSLAAVVKGIVGAGVKVTYAADWSEYHHTDGGWYNLDPLWASPDIDFIGIDAYFPLTAAPQSEMGYGIQQVIDGWTEGEGYDFYYTDPERTTTAPLAAPYAWKNIQWWWENEHVNPDSAATAWVPESKPIWFTEYGFPSVDGATNRPNVFYDPASQESFFPYHSRGRADFRAQRMGLAGAEAKWKDSAMIERRFVWTWDARPFPYWPDLTSVWADGPLWKYGHWVQGKLGLSGLAAIVADLCERAGLESGDYDVSRLTDRVEGYVIAGRISARAAIEQLMAGFFFDAAESDYALKFIPRGGAPVAGITEDELLPSGGDARELLSIIRQQEIELPQKVNLLYINRTANYQPGNQLSQRQSTDSREALTLNLPIVFADQQAKAVADVTLFNRWMERTAYHFMLPPEYAALEPCDVTQVTAGGAAHSIRITNVQMGQAGALRVEGVAEDASVYDFYSAPGEGIATLADNELTPVTRLELLDIPALPGDAPDKGVLRAAAAGLSAGWRGAIVYRSGDGGASYRRYLDIGAPAVMGAATTALANGPTAVFDNANAVTVSLIAGGELESATGLAVLNGANAALLGDELLQFTTANLLEPGKYTLSGLLRGRLGTEHATGSHAAGERFVLLDGALVRDALPNQLIGLPRDYKPVTLGSTLGAATAQSFTYNGVALKPYSPVHVTGVRDGGGGLTISWVRRTRLGGEWRDLADIPLTEERESYEIDILDGADAVRTLVSAVPTVSYSAAEQTADFGGPQSSVAVIIYQISAVAGRGYGAAASV